MFKIVPDTNVLISAVISNGYEFELLKLAKLGKLDLILSYEILWEFEEVIKRDKDDNKIIEAAVEGKVNYIISGDKDLQDLKEYDGIEIINAREFLDIFNIGLPVD